jgi:hypothetical protein
MEWDESQNLFDIGSASDKDAFPPAGGPGGPGAMPPGGPGGPGGPPPGGMPLGGPGGPPPGVRS